MWPDSVKTLDVNWICFQYLLRHKSCGRPTPAEDDIAVNDDETVDDNLNDDDNPEVDVESDLESDSDTESDSESENDSESESDSETDSDTEMEIPGDHDHGYALNPSRRIIRPDDATLFSLLNSWKGTALTATPTGVTTKNHDVNDNNQLWFKQESAIVSYDGRVLCVNEIGEKVSLVRHYERNNPKHNWNVQLVGQNYDHRITSSYNNLVLDLVGQYGFFDTEGIDVGGNKRKGPTALEQFWKINELED